MNQSPIFVVKSLGFNRRIGFVKQSEKPNLEIRDWGFYHEFQMARDSVLKNVTGINENGSYPWAIITVEFPGLCQSAWWRTDCWFYQWIGSIETGGYQRTDSMPPEVKKYFDDLGIAPGF